jgi:hypothetical protein
MQTDTIEAIGIDEGGSLWVKPATATFPYIYRAGKEVHWDVEHLRLCSPRPREWSYAAWFRQIRDAAVGEYGVELKLTQSTTWSGIDPELRQAIAGIDSGVSSDETN